MYGDTFTNRRRQLASANARFDPHSGEGSDKKSPGVTAYPSPVLSYSTGNLDQLSITYGHFVARKLLNIKSLQISPMTPRGYTDVCNFLIPRMLYATSWEIGSYANSGLHHDAKWPLTTSHEPLIFKDHLPSSGH